MVEIHGHGGRAVVAAVLDALSATGLTRLAEPGDFTRRAFENGKLDLSEAEGLADLIEAETELQRRQAINQSSGYLKDKVDCWRQDLIGAMALVEAAIDFSDEPDVPRQTLANARDIATKIESALIAALADSGRGEIVRDGFRVVLAGPPNVGKSSLLNALAAREVAIVSPEAGTTRDVIEVAIDLDGLPVMLSDTAGVREAESLAEREGIRRAVERAGHADLVLWLVDADVPPGLIPPEIRKHDRDIRYVLTKIDLPCAAGTELGVPSDAFRVSARTGQGLSELVAGIGQIARAAIRPDEPVLATRQRHRLALEATVGHLQAFRIGDAADIEMRAEDLRMAAAELGRIIGVVNVEDILDRIFASFCIGK